MSHVFNKTMANILSNLIPHETVSCNEKESPWINSTIKHFMKNMNSAYKIYFKKIEIMNNLQHFKFFRDR